MKQVWKTLIAPCHWLYCQDSEVTPFFVPAGASNLYWPAQVSQHFEDHSWNWSPYHAAEMAALFFVVYWDTINCTLGQPLYDGPSARAAIIANACLLAGLVLAGSKYSGFVLFWSSDNKS